MVGRKIFGTSPVDVNDKRRLCGLSLFLFFLFGTLLIQFYFLQIRDQDHWKKKGALQHYLLVQETAKRGAFYTNPSLKKEHPEKAQKLVVDIEKFHLHIDPDSIPARYRKEIAEHLKQMLGYSGSSAEKLFFELQKKSRDRLLSSWLARDTKDAVQLWWQGYAKEKRIAKNALFFVTDYQRSYPFGKMLGQVLHTLHNTKEKGADSAEPTGGLEWQFHELLKGKNGTRRLRRSPHHSFEMGEMLAQPADGADIYLTIHHVLQAIAEEELEKGVKRANAKRGWLVMMDPKTGAILALAQYPFFYPANYSAYFCDSALQEDTRVHAITDALEPGSVMKIITAVIALKINEERKEQGLPLLIDPNEKIPTADGQFPGRKKPIRDVSLHRFLNMPMAIQKSSNIYCGRLVERILEVKGKEWYRRQLVETFGFGKKTGVELPGETAGKVPQPGKKHPNGKLEWSVPTPYSLAIGYNLQANTLQVLRAFAVLANGGYLVQPTLVRKIVYKDGEEGERETPLDVDRTRLASFPRVLSQETCRQALDLMQYVTYPGGSGHRASVAGFTEFGKTSTEEKVIGGKYQKKLHVSTFTGGVLVDDPPFVMAITMDEPEYGVLPGLGRIHHGASAAASVFRKVARRSLEYLGIPEDDPYGFPAGDPRNDPERAHWGAEVRRLQELYEKWNVPK